MRSRKENRPLPHLVDANVVTLGPSQGRVAVVVRARSLVQRACALGYERRQCKPGGIIGSAAYKSNHVRQAHQAPGGA
jgi:hypothetical protein